MGVRDCFGHSFFYSCLLPRFTFSFLGDTTPGLYLSGFFLLSLLCFRSVATRIGDEPIGAAAISPCRL